MAKEKKNDKPKITSNQSVSNNIANAIARNDLNLIKGLISSTALKKILEANDIFDLIKKADLSNQEIQNADKYQNSNGRKLEVFSALLTKLDSVSTNYSEINRVMELKSKVLFAMAKIYSSTEKTYLGKLGNTEFDYQAAIQHYEKAWNANENIFKNCQNKVTAIIEGVSISHPDQAIKLCENLILQRYQFLSENTNIQQISIGQKPYQLISKLDLSKFEEQDLSKLLNACISYATTANSIKIKNDELNISSLNYLNQAYNIAIKTNNTDQLSYILNLQSSIYKSVGYEIKANYLQQLAKNIKNEKVEQTLIKKAGIIHPFVLEVIREINNSILEPIQDPSKRGKWVEKNAFFIDYGVGGYLQTLNDKIFSGTDQDNITKKNIAYTICLETIILSIINSDEQNPTSAIDFAVKYPKIVGAIIDSNPELFLNNKFFEILVQNSDQYKDLINLTAEETSDNIEGLNFNYKQKIEKKLEGRNLEQEEAIRPYVIKRIEKVTNYMVSLLKSYSDNNKETFLENLSDDYLKSVIGNNLGLVPNILDIARTIILCEVVENTLKNELTNFSPINSIVGKYSNIAHIALGLLEKKGILQNDMSASVLNVLNTNKDTIIKILCKAKQTHLQVKNDTSKVTDDDSCVGNFLSPYELDLTGDNAESAYDSAHI